MNQVLRREVKYFLGLEEYYRYSHQFSKIFQADTHNGTDGYMVRSLYFDTLEDTDYFEKESGVDPRRKMRLRCYSANSGAVLLEMKQKQGDQQRKRSLSIKREDAAAIIRGEYTPLRAYREPFAAECYGLLNMRCYLPRVVTQYDRKAYLARENNIRITFDRNIRATTSCFDIFSESLAIFPVMEQYGVVLEVKYDGFLPHYIKTILDVIDKSALSASKYVMSRG